MNLKDALLDYRKWMDPVVWSNGLFAVNATLWASVGQLVCAKLLLIAGLVSAYHHRLFEQNRTFHRLDMFFSISALVATVLVSLNKMNYHHWCMALIFLGVGLYLKRLATHCDHDYEGYHTGWHVCVFGGQAVLALSHL